MLESVMSVAPGSKTVDSHDETGTKTGPKNVFAWDQMPNFEAVEEKNINKINGRCDRI